MLYATYGTPVLGALIGGLRNKVPGAPEGCFLLGRWLKPICVVFICWAIVVIVALIAPSSNRAIGIYVLGFEAVGALWYVRWLRHRLRLRCSRAALASGRCSRPAAGVRSIGRTQFHPLPPSRSGRVERYGTEWTTLQVRTDGR